MDLEYRVIVVGFGDHFASDAVAGLEVADHLRRASGHICEVRSIESCSPIFFAEQPPNTIVIFTDSVRSGSRPGTIHGISLSTSEVVTHAMQFGSNITRGLRPEIQTLLHSTQRHPPMYLIGIEIEKFDPGIGITTGVHTAVLEVVRELAKLNGKGQPKLPFFPDFLRSD